MSTNPPRRRRVWLTLLVLAILLFAVRIAVGFSVGSTLPDNPLGFTVFDALLIAVLFVGSMLAAVLFGLGQRYRSVYRSVQKRFPETPVLITSVLPSTVSALRQFGEVNGLKENSVAAVVFSSNRADWWVDGRSMTEAASVVSDSGITLRAGTIDHFGSRDALILEVGRGGASGVIPVAVVTESSDRLIPKALSSKEIAARAFQIREALSNS